MQKINKYQWSGRILSGLFILSLVFSSLAVGSTPVLAKSFKEGDLIKLKGLKGAAVYQIGADGKKYVYPDQKTYMTWHSDFKDVQSVEQSDIDNVADGGTVTVQPGAKLLTHRDTAKVYLVGGDGELFHIKDEATAKQFFGDKWSILVIDIDPGIFAATYKNNGQVFSETNLPDGVLVQEPGDDDYYIIHNGLKRRVLARAFNANELFRKFIIRLKNNIKDNEKGDDVGEEEDDIKDFRGKGKDKIVICHKSGGKSHTIRIAEPAWSAHQAHGDVKGACDDDDDDNATSTIDLLASSMTVSKAEPKVGEAVTITVNAKNNGTSSLTSNTGISNYLASFGNFTQTTSTLPSVTTTDPLVPGEAFNYVFTGSWNVAGTTTLEFKLDNSNLLAESNEANNVVSKAIRVFSTSTVDLLATEISVNKTEPLVGEDVTVTVKGKNNGTVELLSTLGISSYLASFGNFTFGTTTLPIVTSTDPLVAGEVFSYIFSGKWNDSGTTTMEFKIDNGNFLVESDETNNIVSKIIKVLPMTTTTATTTQ